MSCYILEKKREHENAAAEALRKKDYAAALEHTVHAANYTLDLAD
jgi:hypothetical protein